jgi:outer membrane immunogenic protein
MTRFTSLAFAAALLGTVSAQAADLAPAPVEPYAPAVLPFSWTGFYVGAHAGYGTGSSDLFIDAKGAGDIGDWSSDGFFGGAQIGYNQQFGGFVIGAEIDGSFSGIEGDLSLAGERIAETELTWFGTARLRAGFAWDRALFYGTGGVAVGEVENTLAPGLDESVSGSDTSVGWTAGLGMEYAITDNWSAKVEYLHVDLGDNSFTVEDTDIEFNNEFDLFRVGVNYRF